MSSLSASQGQGSGPQRPGSRDLRGSVSQAEPGRCSCCAPHTTLCGGEERGSSSQPRSLVPRRAAEDGQDLGIWAASEDGRWTSNTGEQAEQRDRVRGRA